MFVVTPAARAVMERIAEAGDELEGIALDVQLQPGEPVPFALTQKAHDLLHERYGALSELEVDRFRCRGTYGRRWEL